MQKARRADYGGIRGTLAYAQTGSLPGSDTMPEAMTALWLTDRGVCAGYLGGIFKNLTEPRYLSGVKAQQGSGLVRSSKGTMQYLSVINY
jgi:hypothetical protein